MLRQLLLLLIFFSFIPAEDVYTQDAPAECDSLFCSDEVMDLQLELYYDSLLAGGVSESVRYGGILKILKNKRVIKTLHVQLSKRGHFRKFPNICDFPPLRIHFNKEEIKGTEFHGLNKVKIVTHCQNNDTSFEQFVVQEYLIYKAYNLLTDFSFKVRLARIKYVDLSRTFPDVSTYTFFIENPSSLENRLSGTCLDVKYILPKNLDQKQYALMTMFQYMMINQDWSVTLEHNLEIFARKNDFRLIPIPFDFDMCGIIAIPYNSPAIPFKKGEKPERNFLGKDIPRERIIEAILILKKHQYEIIKIFNTSPLLTAENRKTMVNHLIDFYESTSDKEKVKQLFSMEE